MVLKYCIASVLFIGTTISQLSVDAEERAVENQELRQELLDMYAADQQARVELFEQLGKAGFEFGSADVLSNPKVLYLMVVDGLKTTWQDAVHRARLKAIIDEHGWPVESLVGKDGAHAAWLLVQHADADLPFQERCLTLMREAPEGEVSPKNMAYLTDRVLVNEGCQQCYGTQLGEDFSPRPIYDRSTVDLRRESVGLPPLATYVKEARAGYEKMLKRE